MDIFNQNGTSQEQAPDDVQIFENKSPLDLSHSNAPMLNDEQFMDDATSIDIKLIIEDVQKPEVLEKTEIQEGSQEQELKNKDKAEF
jgi:hypothetical protein